jgi:cytochrome c
MSGSLTTNKILGGILATGLTVVGLHEVSGMVFEPHPVEKPGYRIDVVDTSGGADAGPELMPDWGTVLPTADVAAGEGVFAKCASCHKLDATNGTGPGLAGAVGRAVAAHGGFAYSPALKEHAAEAPTWTYDELDHFLKAPAKYIPGTKMTFVGLKNQADRVNVIAFLRERAGGTLPIPAPDPTRQPPAAGAVEGGAAPPAPGAAGAGQPTATGETAQAGQPAQTPAAGAAAAPAQQKGSSADHQAAH